MLIDWQVQRSASTTTAVVSIGPAAKLGEPHWGRAGLVGPWLGNTVDFGPARGRRTCRVIGMVYICIAITAYWIRAGVFFCPTSGCCCPGYWESKSPWCASAKRVGMAALLILEYQKSSCRHTHPLRYDCAFDQPFAICRWLLSFLFWLVLQHRRFAQQPIGVDADFWYPSMRCPPLWAAVQGAPANPRASPAGRSQGS